MCASVQCIIVVMNVMLHKSMITLKLHLLSCWKFRFAFDARFNDLQFLVLELIPFAFLFI